MKNQTTMIASPTLPASSIIPNTKVIGRLLHNALLSAERVTVESIATIYGMGHRKSAKYVGVPGVNLLFGDMRTAQRVER